jgi:hypothetical protein
LPVGGSKLCTGRSQGCNCMMLLLLAGKQQVPGVYLASSTALCQQDSQTDDSDSYAVGLAALSGCQPERGSSSSPHSNQGGIGRAGSSSSVAAGAGSPVQHAPLMHVGRPTRLGSPVAMRPQYQQQQHPVGPIPAGVQDEGDGGQQPGAGSSIKDVYGQPRVVSPALPSTYSKVTQPVCDGYAVSLPRPPRRHACCLCLC